MPMPISSEEFWRKIMSLYLSATNTMTYLRGYLEKSTNSYNTTMTQLSSGNKITGIADNPVELSKSAGFTASISANAQAMSNVDLGKNMLDMAESSQNIVLENLQAINDLCLQAANGTYTATDKDAMLEEIRKRLDNIDNVAKNTNYNGVYLLDGSTSNIKIQTGANAESFINVGSALIDVRVAQLGGGIAIAGTVTGSTWTDADIATFMGKIGDSMSEIIAGNANIGSYQNRLDAKTDILTSIEDNLKVNRSLISDTDVAEASANLVQSQILQQASASLLTQTTQIPTMILNLLGKS